MEAVKQGSAAVGLKAGRSTFACNSVCCAEKAPLFMFSGTHQFLALCTSHLSVPDLHADACAVCLLSSCDHSISWSGAGSVICAATEMGFMLQSKTHVVVATLRRSQTELSSSLRKVFKIDDHMGIAISGIVSDGRSLCRYLRNECLNHKCDPMLLDFVCQ